MSAFRVQPYSMAWQHYHDAGWPGVLPLPPNAKTPPPDGYTGARGSDPTLETLQLWARECAHGNVALRLPRGVVGIDVDDYDGKRGGETLADLEAAHGPLPPTWRSSARPGAVSGIRFYRVPIGTRFERGNLGEHIDVIQHHHRYAVVWPSTNPKAGGATYMWFDPSGEPASWVPRVDELPELPKAWLNLQGKVETSSRSPQLKVESFEDGSLVIYPPQLWEPFELPKTIGAGGRNETLFKYACSLAGRGVRQAEALVLLEEAYKRCRPPWRDEEPEALWQRVQDAYGSVKRPRAVPASAAAMTPDEEAAWVRARQAQYDELFTTPQLRHVRQAAVARMVSPVALLACVLARVATETPQNILLPPTIGAEAPLNFGVALVGCSGSSKSSTVALSRSLIEHRPIQTIEVVIEGQPPVRVEDPHDPVERAVGSGEGLVEAFLTWDQGSRRLVLNDDPRRLLTVDEIDTLGGLQSRSGATIASTLRTALTGGQLGQMNASAERRRHVPAGAYRLALIAGVQPLRSGVLLDDADAGTPQRFLWAHTQDLTIDPDVASAAVFPGSLGWKPPQVPTDREVFLEYPESIKAAIRASHAANARGVSDDPLAGHRNLTRLKVSALLALLHGYLSFGLAEWEMAGKLLELSDEAVDVCRAELSRVAQEKSRGKAREAGEAAILTDRMRDDADLKATKKRVLAIVVAAGADGVVWSDVRKGITARIRPRAEEARDALVSEGQLVVEEIVYQARAGVRVRSARLG